MCLKLCFLSGDFGNKNYQYRFMFWLIFGLILNGEITTKRMAHKSFNIRNMGKLREGLDKMELTITMMDKELENSIRQTNRDLVVLRFFYVCNLYYLSLWSGGSRYTIPSGKAWGSSLCCFQPPGHLICYWVVSIPLSNLKIA